LLNFGTFEGTWDYCVGETTPVGSYPVGSSPYGLMDMSGNVEEWVNDWIDPDYYENSPYENPQGPDSGTSKGARGGSWGSDWVSARVTSRGSRSIDVIFTNANPGFRCAASTE
jgi:formylglycine-generating enzyme required for sulfatase activity